MARLIKKVEKKSVYAKGDHNFADEDRESLVKVICPSCIKAISFRVEGVKDLNNRIKCSRCKSFYWV